MADLLKKILFTDIFGPIIVKYLIEEYTSKHLILFADTCKTLRKYKFYTRMKLKKYFSNLYYYDSVFRKQVIDHIDKIEKQYLNNNKKLLMLDLYKSLDIQIVNNIFKHVHSVDLSYSENIINPSALKSMKYVNLSYCTLLEDVSELYNVNTLLIPGCYNCVGISKLTNVNKLDISCCKNFTCDDLQYLTNVEYLTLSGCDQITTITKLPHKLAHLYFSLGKISDMNNISSEASLNLVTVNLTESNISNIDKLYNVEYLILRHCANIINISILKNIIILNVSYCNNIKEFSCVKDMLQLVKLDVSNCKQITNRDLTYFTHIESINLSRCEQITDVSPLCNSRYLNLSYCYNLIDVSPLSKVKNLKLRGCSMLFDVSALSNVHTLDLSNCPYITDISALDNVHDLRINNYKYLANMCTLGNNYIFNLR